VELTGSQRIAIDSLGDSRMACGDEHRFGEYMYSLLQRCAKNVSVIMTQEVPELFGVGRLSQFGISHFSDNVVLPRIRHFEITREGLSLGDHFPPRVDPSLAVQAMDRR
jgi:circadian clock protein KaiC